MEYKIVDKSLTVQPDSGGYKDWKQIIADEAKNSCVYCCIHESQFGGIRNFHIEHYKPKSKFKELENVINNLFYSCPICNTFKGNHWVVVPEDGNFESTYYPDPSLIDYSKLLEVNKNNFTLFGKNITGEYLIQRLGLNRQQLILERKKHNIEKEYLEALERLRNLVEVIKIKQRDNVNPYLRVIIKSFDLIVEGTNEIIELGRTIPYKREDERK